MAPVKKPKAPKARAKATQDSFKMLSDRDHVRLRKGMYIPNINYTVYELIDNGMDEHAKGYGNELELSINSEGVVKVRDYGRGLPVDVSEDVPDCTIAELCLSRLKAGTKFESKGKTGGLNGVGSSAINFLCSYFKVWVIKDDGKNYYMEFEKGEIKEKLHEIEPISDRSGTIIECLPDPEMWEGLGKLNINEINNRMKQLCYLNPGVKITVDIDYDNHEINEVYDFPEGVKTYIEDLTANTEVIHEPWTINKSVPINDSDTCDISVSFVWTQAYTDNVYAFTNNVANTDGKSSNITGFKRGVAAAVKECFENEYPKSKTQLTAEDTREGIVAVISIKIDAPNYIGQGKDYLNMPVVASTLYNEMKDFIEDQFDKLPNDKDNILTKVIESSKIREAAHKAKEAARKTKGLVNKKVEKLVRCASKDPEACELFLVEGDSAASTATTACDKKTQAILPVFGKIPNVEEMSLDKVLSSDKLKDILFSLECGIGDDFNIDNIRFHKIIIMSDADVDGYHIATLYITLFYRYFRPLIEAGYLYLSCPPLYKVVMNKKETVYAMDDAALAEIKAANPDKRFEVTYLKGLGELSAEGLWNSTMDPNQRTLIRVSIEDAEEAERIVSMCMNSKVMNAEKKHYIMNDEEAIELI